MNLSDVVAGAVAAVNPRVLCQIRRSTGNTQAAGGKRVPTYADPVPVTAQIQSLTYNDLTAIDGLNIQGVKRAMYLDGDWAGLVRSDRRGGDLITTPDGRVWLVAMVLEHWDSWVKVAVTLQDGS